MKIVSLLVLIFILPQAKAQQNATFLETDKKNRVGSDQSLKQSTGYAMNALMDLSNLNISSALKNGVNAYGKYQNSETLDRLSNQNMFHSASMVTAGDKGPELVPVITTYRRLDPKFLKEGAVGKIASDFEKKSGMKREQFLMKMSEASENKIKRSDPNLVGKVLQRFDGFVSSIPNPQFRSGIKKAVSMVPQKTVSEVIGKAVKQFTPIPGAPNTVAVSAGANSSISVATPSPLGTSAPGASNSQDLGAVASSVESGNRGLASTSIPGGQESMVSPLANGIDLNHGIVDGGPAPTEAPKKSLEVLSSAFQAAKDAQEKEPTIFDQVHLKYRSLSPGLQGLSP